MCNVKFHAGGSRQRKVLPFFSLSVVYLVHFQGLLSEHVIISQLIFAVLWEWSELWNSLFFKQHRKCSLCSNILSAWQCHMCACLPACSPAYKSRSRKDRNRAPLALVIVHLVMKRDIEPKSTCHGIHSHSGSQLQSLEGEPNGCGCVGVWWFQSVFLFLFVFALVFKF